VKIFDLLDLHESDIKEVKLHFATGGNKNNDALNEFIKGTLKEWQEWQNFRNFERKYVLTLVYLNPREWLFAGIFQVVDVKGEKGDIRYSTFLTEKGKDFIGRLIVGYKKEFRQSYPNCETCINEIELIEIRRYKYQVQEFPGYENVNISFETLKLIVETEDRSWKTALSSIKGIYLISDITNGKLYVGAAYGEENFWQRWSAYSKSGHGDNIELKAINDKCGFEYFNNFNYSILEIFKNTTDLSEIQEREKYWKKILLTREFGYNKN
jgi:hypothetical protein